MKIVEFANEIDPKEMAHNEPPRLNLLCVYYCLPENEIFFLKFSRRIYVV